MMDASSWRLALIDRCFEGSHGQSSVHSAIEGIADNLARPSVKDHSQVDEPLRDGNIADVGNPEHVRRDRGYDRSWVMA